MAYKIQDGKVYAEQGRVAVLCTSGYGAGWYTDNRRFGERLLFEPRLVEWALRCPSGAPNWANASSPHRVWEEDGRYIVQTLFPDDAPYTGGLRHLYVEWVPGGELFQINEYNGSESVAWGEELKLIRA